MSRLANLLALARRANPPVGTTPHDVIHRENKWRLLRYRRPASEPPQRPCTPLLLVPSIINRYYVLDLLPQKSVAGYFVSRGFDVYCMDWGTPAPEDRFVTFDDVVEKAVGRAVRKVCRASGVDATHILGYCLGGTFATIYAALHPEHVRTLVLLAAPIDFSDQGLLRQWTTTETFDTRALVDAFGLVPPSLMQLGFQMLRPTTKAARLVGLLDRLGDAEFLDGFFALEKWGSDTASLPGEFYVSLIERLYRDNALVRGELSVAGAPVRLEHITAPLCAMTFVHDTIAPPEACSAILSRVASEDTVHIHKTGSHVGGAVSSRALATLWPEVCSFLLLRD